MRIAIIGGGISGLAAAQRLVARQPSAQVTVFEASEQLGGILGTTFEQQFAFEQSADSFIVSTELPWAGELCGQIGLDLIGTSPQHRGALVLRGDHLYPVPPGLHLMSVRNLRGLLTTPLLSPAGRLRAALEPLIPAGRAPDESLASFARRRFGRQMFRRIIQPLVAGIYTADPEKLSMAAALPQFLAMEKKYGSLRAAAKAQAADQQADQDGGARYTLFRSPAAGMQALIDRLEEYLGEVTFRRKTAVTSLHREASGWGLRAGTDHPPELFDRLIVATSAPAFAMLIQPLAGRLADLLRDIEHVSTSVACFGLRRNQIAHPLNAFGFVVPSTEPRDILAVSFSSVKFPPRCPSDQVILRVFLGGALRSDLAERSDTALRDIAYREVSAILGIQGDPLAGKLFRWQQTTPQYHLGHCDRVAEIARCVARLPGVEFAGNAYQGIGIPQCVRSGWEAADRVLDQSGFGSA